MDRHWFYFVLWYAFVPGSVFASHKKAVDPRVQQVRTIFVKGNNEAAVKARENLSKWTCFRLANDAGQADATLEFSQQQSVSGAVLSANRERSIVSADLTTKDGDVVWSASATQDAGLINTGAGSAARYVLNHLQADAFPEIKLGFRGLDQSNCPEIGTPSASASETSSTTQSPTPPESTAGSPQQSQSNAAETKEIKLGMTTDEVEKVLGAPVTKVDLGEKVLYKYKDMTVEFHDGKVTDVR